MGMLRRGREKEGRFFQERRGGKRKLIGRDLLRLTFTSRSKRGGGGGTHWRGGDWGSGGGEDDSSIR